MHFSPVVASVGCRGVSVSSVVRGGWGVSVSTVSSVSAVEDGSLVTGLFLGLHTDHGGDGDHREEKSDLANHNTFW